MTERMKGLIGADELMEKWPGIAGADAAAVFGREAWAMPVGYNGNDATLVKDATRERDVIGLEIRFDAERHFLGLAVSDAYQDYSIGHAFVLGNANYSRADKVEYLPIYFTMFLKKDPLPPDMVYELPEWEGLKS